MLDNSRKLLVLVLIVGSFCIVKVKTNTLETTKRRMDARESEDLTQITDSEDTPTDELETATGTEATVILIAEKPKRTLKTVASPDLDSTVVPTVRVPHDSFYAMGSDNIICAAAKFDATFIMTAGGAGGITANLTVPVPRNSTFEGSCDESPTLIISLRMEALSLTLKLVMTFNKTDDMWTLANVEIRAPNDDKTHRETHRASSKDLESFRAPLGQSLYCQIPHDIVLEDVHKEDNYFKAYLSINNVRMQAYNVPPEYSPAKLCPPHIIRYHSDEAVFVTAGMLGVLAVGVIIGYGIYRGLKSKKVDYGVM